MSKHIFEGSGVALITPFKDGKVDFEALENLVEWHIQQGTDALIACGTTGEASTLEDDEHIAIVKSVIEKTKGRVPVIAGSGSNNTAHAIWMSKELEKIGVDALLIVTPYYNKCTQKGLIAHYTSIADAVTIPIILYSVASRTGVNIEPSTVVALSSHPRIVGLKEASGNISQVVEIARVIPEGFSLYSGNDDMIVPLLSCGGQGVISVLGNVIPKDVHDMVIHYLNGDVKSACRLQLATKPLNDALFCEVNPIPVKHAMNLMGKCSANMRQPLSPMEPINLERLTKEMKAYGVLPQ